jgi:hypothetical protein
MESLERKVERAVVELAVNVTANLTDSTPVDTGWARANWVPSLTAPFEGVSGTEGRPGPEQGLGLAEVARFKLAHVKALVTNNVPYIRRLNAGHSQQAPSGFVETAIAQALADAQCSP